MADVETTAQEAQPSNTVPATPAPNLDEQVKAAVENARREAQAQKDREVARLHKEYQEREKHIRQQAVGRLKEAGDDNADAWDRYLDTEGKAAAYDVLQQQREAERAWETWVAHTADAHGLDPADPRLRGAESAQDLLAKARKAMTEDAASERKRLREEADAKAKERLDGAIGDGNMNVMTGQPAGARSLEAEYKAALAKIPRGQIMAITKLQSEYRKKGLKL